MIVVHHLNNSRSQRILWLLEELGLPYEIRRYQRVWELDGEPMETAGEVIANIGLILEHLEREVSR